MYFEASALLRLIRDVVGLWPTKGGFSEGLARPLPLKAPRIALRLLLFPLIKVELDSALADYFIEDGSQVALCCRLFEALS